jgi:hypothetical protein
MNNAEHGANGSNARANLGERRIAAAKTAGSSRTISKKGRYVRGVDEGRWSEVFVASGRRRRSICVVCGWW